MEVFGHRRGRRSCSTVHNPMHSWGTKDPLDGGCMNLGGGVPQQPDWHVWKLLWTPETIAFFIDDDEEEPIFSYERPASSSNGAMAAADGDAFPYTLPQYFILNLAVGGNGPSEPVDMDALAHGVHLSVDYVRVYGLSSPSLQTQVDEDASGGSARSVSRGGELLAEESFGYGDQWQELAAQQLEGQPRLSTGIRGESAATAVAASTQTALATGAPALSSPLSPLSPLLLLFAAALGATLTLWVVRRRSRSIARSGLSKGLLNEAAMDAA